MGFSRQALLIATGVLCFASQTEAQPTDNVFRTYLYDEPHSLNPAKLQGEELSYLFFNLFRGLYGYNEKSGPYPLGAVSCDSSRKLVLECSLNSKMKWSDGTEVVAEDYVRGFRFHIDPDNHSREAGLLSSLKNGREILHRQKKPGDLEVTAPQKHLLRFNFEKEDHDFIVKLSSSILVPIKSNPSQWNSSNIVGNGPYRLKEWKKGERIVLEPNPFYPLGNKKRPPVEFLFMSEEAAALNLFEQGHLHLLRKLPSAHIEKYKTRVGFFQVPLSRFDYIGFGEPLSKEPELRKALSLSVDYHEFARVFHSLGRPGCPSIPDVMLKHIPCYDFSLRQAKQTLAKVSPKLTSTKLKFYFSSAGGDDIRRVAEWYQSQWKKNLSLDVQIQALETGVLTQELKKNPPALFRRGIALDRASCLAALENFVQDHPDNALQLKDPKYDQIIENLRQAKEKSKQKDLCSQGVSYLMDRHLLIPQGRIHFTFLRSTNVHGLEVNELNQLDLSNLSLK